ncbi:hypothetical protein QBC46DRAFT_345145 [Diplogelasinospora grovesii]|uniref:Uncharacterized protein n=1 Tax=Diplogelasinospora grovesii TaxID=303347 RepID=A0AAN6N0Q4_9PEZI|nr:hypothetical protein QBC46DRAFT_345145 [Diplogelasinospora grovesii]
MPPFRRTLLHLLSGLFLVCLFFNMVSVVSTTHRDVTVMKFKLGFAEARLDYQIRLIGEIQQQMVYLHHKIDRVDARRRHLERPVEKPRCSGLADLFRKLSSPLYADNNTIKNPKPSNTSTSTISRDDGNNNNNNNNNFDTTNPEQKQPADQIIGSQTKTQQQPSVDNDSVAETRDSWWNYYMPKLFVPM